MFRSKAQSDTERFSKNDAIFHRLGVDLASHDEAPFINAATKLNGWMKNARAYYPEARPKIIELVETAGRTLATLSNLPPGVLYPPESFSSLLHPRRIVFNDLVNTLLDHVRKYESDGELNKRAILLTGLARKARDLETRSTEGPSEIHSIASSTSKESSPKLAENTELPQAVIQVPSPAPSTNSQVSAQVVIQTPFAMAQLNQNAQAQQTSSDPGRPSQPSPISIQGDGKSTVAATTKHIPIASNATTLPSTSLPSAPRPKKPSLMTTGRLSSSPAVSSPLSASFLPGTLNSSGPSPFPSSLASGSTVTQPRAGQSGSPPILPPSLMRDRSGSAQAQSSSSRSEVVPSPTNMMPPPILTPLSSIGKGKGRATSSGSASASPVLPTPPPSAALSSTQDAHSTTSSSPNPDQSISRPKKKPKLTNAKSALPAASRGYQPWELADLNWFQKQQKATSPSKPSDPQGVSPIITAQTSPANSDISRENEHVKVSPNTPTVSFSEQATTKRTTGDVLQLATNQNQDAEMQDVSDIHADSLRASSKGDAESSNAQMKLTPGSHEKAGSQPPPNQIEQDPAPSTATASKGSLEEPEAADMDQSIEMQIDVDQPREETTLPGSSDSEATAFVQRSPSEMSVSPSPRIQRNEMESVFNSGTTVLVSFNLGMTAGKETVFEFELTENQDSLLNDWKTRLQHVKSTQHVMCLSLACYAKDEVCGVSVEDEEKLKESLLSLTPKWPTNARLQAFIGTKRTFLAPPFLMTGEKFVDISKFVEDKNVTVRIEYQADYSDCLFALYCHPPTPSQLRELEEGRKKEKKWKSFLAEIKRPFTVEELFGDLMPRF
ncbi:hypothetical protein SCHPADRAFT_926063 [Schizopora paradoxa]|uniref:Uncharacterized protein n=1 Tax=Schizopora paradoxa TaxID=27342 RepID=A0A0H2RZS5_9AGAM|nr:hypothetical protein SCHPADRAFT_926063 [Schizopora paradoxa]